MELVLHGLAGSKFVYSSCKGGNRSLLAKIELFASFFQALTVPTKSKLEN